MIVYTGRDLSTDDEQQLRRYSNSIIIKGAKSPERLLDEVSLFLHQVVSELPPEQRRMIQKARHRDAALEGRRILIVEDDVRNVYSLTSIFEERHVRHVSRLIEDLLDIARIDQGKISLKTERLLLQDVLAFAVETCQPHIAAACHRLILDVLPEQVWLEGDHARVTQMVSNLLGNAAKYTPPGGEIAMSVGLDGGWAVIDISDTGVGIAADMQGKIFDLFAQVRGASGTAQEGLGIGLALVKQLAELHGGTIDLKCSVPGGGSTFRLRLPVDA